MNILLLEDEVDLRAVFEEFFAMEGHRTRGTACPRTALGLLEQEDFDLLLLDYALPGPTGIEFFEETRRRGYMIPAVIMSGTIDLFEEKVAEIPGVIACLEKPFSLEILRRLLAGLADGMVCNGKGSTV